MASAFPELLLVEENNSEELREDFADIILWALQKLLLIEERLHSSRISDLIQDFILNQKIAFLWLLLSEPPQVKKQALNLSIFREEKVLRPTEPELDLTDTILWALRKLEVIQNRLYNTGIFAYADNWLGDQQNELLQLLHMHPKHVKRLWLQQQEKANQRKSNQKNPRGEKNVEIQKD